MVALIGGNSASSISPAKGRGGGGGNGSGGSGDLQTYRLVSSVASEAMGIGKTSDVLTVLGGKASCRRKFMLNVHLVDEHGSLVSRDLAIVASVAYAHDHSPVVRDEMPFLAEPPLFTTFNGVEFPAQDRPTRMVAGRASFKLAISLLSSKCDNRLFCICFTPQSATSASVGAANSSTSTDAALAPVCACPPCYSKPIRSISRKRTQSTSASSSAHPLAAAASLSICPAPPPLLLMGGSGGIDAGGCLQLEASTTSSTVGTAGAVMQAYPTGEGSLDGGGSGVGCFFESDHGDGVQRHAHQSLGATACLGLGRGHFGAPPAAARATSCPTISGENDHHGEQLACAGALSSVSPTRYGHRVRASASDAHLQCSSRSSSVTSMRYLSPTSATAGVGGGGLGFGEGSGRASSMVQLDEGGCSGCNGCNGCGVGGGGSRGVEALVLHESRAATHSISQTVGSLTLSGVAAGFGGIGGAGGVLGGGGEGEGGGSGVGDGGRESGGDERFHETDASGSSLGGMVSASCSPVSTPNLPLPSTPGNAPPLPPPPLLNNCCSNDSMRVITSPPCSLSLRLSPSDSGSPTSGALTSESSYDNNNNKEAHQQKHPMASRMQSPPERGGVAAGGTRPQGSAAFSAAAAHAHAPMAKKFPQPTGIHPFRPYATVGPCKIPMNSDFHFGNRFALAPPSSTTTGQCMKRPNNVNSDGDLGTVGDHNSTSILLERVHQLQAVSPAVATAHAAVAAAGHGDGHLQGRHQQLASSGKMNSLMHGFSLGTDARSSHGSGNISGEHKFNSVMTEISLEEEEKSLQYIEVSIQEVSREVQRRKEELRSKRRRLLEDEARMHSIVFQSSSWIESLSGRFSL